jgi:hypothetical protein
MYHLWRQRNDIQHGNQPKTEERLMQRIVWDVRSQIRGKGKFRENDLNVEICSKWGYST